MLSVIGNTVCFRNASASAMRAYDFMIMATVV